MHNLKDDNKGISLIEILVGLAITGIVASMIATILISGSNWFNKQGMVVDAQNEAQIINNIITTALLETAQTVTKSNDTADGGIPIEIVDTGAKKLVYAQSTTSLYVFDSVDSIILDDGHLLSRHVTDFNIVADNYLKEKDILKINIIYTISNSQAEVKQEFSVSPRNSGISFVTGP